MEKLAKIVKSTNPKKLAGLGVAAAVGAVVGVKAVAKKRKDDFANLDAKQKASDLLTTSRVVGEKVVRGVREDLTTVVESVKEQTEKAPACASKCPHCVVKDTFKACCKKGRECSVKNETEEAEETLPEPVKAADVVEAHEATDVEAETAKVAEAAKAEKKPAARKPRAPRAPKNERAPAEPQPAPETPAEEN
jgi:hypothetical protein